MDNFVLSSRVRLTRNLEGIKFSHFLTDKDRYDIDEKLSDIILTIDPHCHIVNFEDLSPEKRMLYLGNSTLSEEFVKNGRKLVYDTEGEWVLMLNEIDHIRLFALEIGFNTRKMFQRLYELLDKIEARVDFAFDEKLGYLTSSIINVGSGLRLSALVNLYGLVSTKEIENVIESADQMGYRIQHYGGENKDSGLFLISNVYSLGLREDDMVKEFEDLLESLYPREMKAREDFFSDSDELELAFEEMMDINTLQEMEWDLLLYYVSLIDALQKNHLTLKDPVALKKLIFNATDTEIMYRHGVEEADIRRYRLDMLRRITVQIRYRVMN